MHLIVTRTFPPEVGGMQNLMYGLAKPYIRFCMPPTSGGKVLVTIKCIIF